MRQDFEILALELKFLKTNWLIISTLKSPSLGDITFTSKIKETLSILLMSDFNITLDNPNFN